MLCTIQLKIPNAFYRWMKYNIFLNSPWAYFCWCYIDFWHCIYKYELQLPPFIKNVLLIFYLQEKHSCTSSIFLLLPFTVLSLYYGAANDRTALQLHDVGHFPSQSSNSVFKRITSHLQLQLWFKKDQTMKRNCLGQMTQENPVQAVSCSVLLGNTKGNTLVFLVKHSYVSN